MHAGGDRRLRGQACRDAASPQSRDAIRLGVHRQRLGDRRRALRDPHGEDERQAGPLLPLAAQVVGVAIVGQSAVGWIQLGRAQARPEMQRRVADDQPRVVLLSPKRATSVARRCSGRRPASRPTRSRTAARAARRWSSSSGSPARGAVQLRRGALGEQHHAAHRTVAGDREVGQQQILRRVARVFDRRDDADVERARAPSRVQRRRARRRPARPAASTIPRSIAP